MRNTSSKTRILIKNALAIIMIGLMFQEVHCQEEEKKHWIGFYLTTPTKTSIREGKSADLNIGNTAWMVEMGLQTRLFDLVGISAGLGYGSIKDHNSFTQSTTWGTLESSFTTLSYDFRAGLWTPEFKVLKNRDIKVSGGSSFGFEGFSGRREIVNCRDCNVEKFRFKGGFMLEPEVNFFFYKDLLGVGTSYRYFLGDGDLNYSWTILKLMMRFGI